MARVPARAGLGGHRVSPTHDDRGRRDAVETRGGDGGIGAHQRAHHDVADVEHRHRIVARDHVDAVAGRSGERDRLQALGQRLLHLTQRQDRGVDVLGEDVGVTAVQPVVEVMPYPPAARGAADDAGEQRHAGRGNKSARFGKQGEPFLAEHLVDDRRDLADVRHGVAVGHREAAADVEHRGAQAQRLVDALGELHRGAQCDAVGLHAAALATDVETEAGEPDAGRDDMLDQQLALRRVGPEFHREVRSRRRIGKCQPHQKVDVVGASDKLLHFGRVVDDEDADARPVRVVDVGGFLDRLGVDAAAHRDAQRSDRVGLRRGRDVEPAPVGGERHQRRGMRQRLHRVMQPDAAKVALQQPILVDDRVRIQHQQRRPILVDQPSPVLAEGGDLQGFTKL